MKRFGILVVVILALAVSAVSVLAAPSTTTTPPPVFKDGRLNAWDAAAPIIVYEPTVSTPATDANGNPTTESTIGSVQVLSWSGVSESATEVLNVPVDQINKAIAAHPNTEFTIASKNGVSLNYSPSGYFWVKSAPDFEGKVYTFTWQKSF